MSKRIIIVGGGYAGADLAKRLDPYAEVVLVEPRPVFVHSSAMIRGVVDPEIARRALIPYDRLLSRGEVRRGRVAAISGEGVTLEDGGEIAGDIIVLATGSSYAAPFKPVGADIDGFRAAVAAAQDAVTAARSIAIVGAGPVGIELAGEIKAHRAAKSVTLITETETLLPEFPAKLGAELKRKLTLLGVEVILGSRAEGLQRRDAPFAGELTLPGGRTIAADLIFPVVGARPEAALAAALPGAVLAPDGRVRTDLWLRPSTLANVYSVGDVAVTGDAMTIVGASRQTPWLARTLRSVVSGALVDSLPAYRAWPQAPILLPLGPQMGNSYLPPAGVVGNTPTRLIKGRSLFIPKYSRLMGRS